MRRGPKNRSGASQRGRQSAGGVRKHVEDSGQAYLDLAGVMFVGIDREQRVTLINRKGCEILGYRREEVIGQNWFDRFLPEDVRATTKEVFDKLMAGRLDVTEYFENPVLTKSGKRRTVLWHNTTVRSEQGEIVGTLSSGEDVTTRRQAEEALRTTEARARAILEAAAEGVVMIKRDGGIVLVNAKIEEMFGYHRDELLGQPVEILLPERLREKHIQRRAAFFSQPRARSMGRGFDLVGRLRDGAEFPIEVSLSFVESAGETLAMAFITDIKERKWAETRLHTEFAVTKILAEFATLADAAPRLLQTICEGVGWQLGELWRADPEANVLRWQGNWHVPALGVERFEQISREMTFPPGVGLPGRVWASGEAAWMTDVARDTEFLRRSAAAEVGLHAAFAFPIGNKSELAGVMAFFSRRQHAPDTELLRFMADIGTRVGQYVKRWRAEEQLRHQREALYQGEKLAAVGRLAAGIVHEMNNPLGIMLSRIEVVLMDAESQNLPSRILEDLRVLHRNTQRVARVARSLLSFARRSPGEHRPVDLNHIVEETLLLVERPMTAERIRIHTHLDPSLPPLSGDSTALQQVLLNLLTNAREAMTGGGEIRIETGRAPGRPNRLRLVVADTGPGIPLEELPRIFDPFYTSKAEGTGLGLSVSYGIIQDHHGTVDVQSEPGRGTMFILTFPAVGALVE